MNPSFVAESISLTEGSGMSEEAPKEEKKDDAKAAEEKAAAEKKAVEEKAATEKKAADEKAAAEKKAGEEKAAAEKKAAEEKAAAEKAAADKAAADKAAADKAAAEAAAEAAAKAAKAKPKAAGAARGKLLLVAWGPSPAGAWEAALTNAGFEVYVERSARLNAFQWANENQPVAIVIDLSQNPDDGKRLASTLRITGSTATIPLVFCDANAAGAAPITSADAVLGALNKL